MCGFTIDNGLGWGGEEKGGDKGVHNESVDQWADEDVEIRVS